MQQPTRPKLTAPAGRVSAVGNVTSAKSPVPMLGAIDPGVSGKLVVVVTSVVDVVTAVNPNEPEVNGTAFAAFAAIKARPPATATAIHRHPFLTTPSVHAIERAPFIASRAMTPTRTVFSVR